MLLKLLKGLKIAVTGDGRDWEARTGDGEVIRGRSSSAGEATADAMRALREAAERRQQEGERR